jgi:hypothetical protein
VLGVAQMYLGAELVRRRAGRTGSALPIFDHKLTASVEPAKRVRATASTGIDRAGQACKASVHRAMLNCSSRCVASRLIDELLAATVGLRACWRPPVSHTLTAQKSQLARILNRAIWI